MTELGVGKPYNANGDENIVAPILEKLGYELHRAKTNVGLGRITNPDALQAAQKEPAGAAK